LNVSKEVLMAEEIAEKSVVQIYGDNESTCGYCKSSMHVGFGVIAYRLTVEHYQALIDRGWRRSGTYLYRPNNHGACCEQLVIRSDVFTFSVSKSQRKVLKRWRTKSDEFCQKQKVQQNQTAMSSKHKVDINQNIEILQVLRESIRSCTLAAGYSQQNLEQIPANVWASVAKMKTHSDQKHDLDSVCMSSTVAFTLARLERSTGNSGAAEVDFEKRKMRSVQRQMEIANQIAKDLEERKIPDLLNISIAEPGFINMILRFSHSHSMKDPVRPQSLEMSSESDSNPKDSAHQLRCIDGKRLQIRVAPSGFQEDEFTLYKKYQRAVHHSPEKELTKSSYVRFLVESPFPAAEKLDDSVQSAFDSLPQTLIDGNTANVPWTGYGSFHVRYCIDSVLVAVGVIDILPACVSSVYVFYDPDQMELSPGVFTALFEASLARALHQHSSRISFLYMGFYIHSCPKMRYKAQYRPCQLLCEETLRWIDFDQASQILDRGGSGIRLAPRTSDYERDADNVRLDTLAAKARIDDFRFLVQPHGRIISFRSLKSIFLAYESHVVEILTAEVSRFAELTDSTLWKDFLFILE